MTTTTFSCAPDNTTDVTFRAWVTALITALTTVGMVQTADTGQINTATVVKPAATNGVAGYAIFRMNDAAQATAPIFIKLEFGLGGGTVATDGPQVWLTVGKSSDGAGNLGGILVARMTLGCAHANSTNQTASLNGLASAGEGWVALIPWLGGTVGSSYWPLPWFIIERVVGNAAIAVTVQAHVASISYVPQLSATTSTALASFPRVLVVNYATAVTTVGAVPVVVPFTIAGATLSGSSSIAAGSVGPVFPWVVVAPGLAPAQCLAALSYPGGDAPGSTFTANVGGAVHTYMAVPLSDNYNAFGIALRPADVGNQAGTISRYVGLAIRWE